MIIKKAYNLSLELLVGSFGDLCSVVSSKQLETSSAA